MLLTLSCTKDEISSESIFKDEEQNMSLKVSSKAPVKWLIKYEYHS